VTDARLPERWLSDRRIQRLADGHYRSFINALLYSVANRSDGVIEPEDLSLITGFAAGAAKALVNAGLWIPLTRGWLIADYEITQTASSELTRLEKLRAGERIKKARQRAKKLAEEEGIPADEEPHVPVDVPGDGPVDDPPGTHQAGRQAGRQAGLDGEQSSKQLFAVPVAAGAENQQLPPWRGAGPSPFDEYK